MEQYWGKVIFVGEIRSAKLMNKKTLLIILCGFVFLGCSIYGITLYNDYSMLKSSSMFADGPVGIAARIPPSVHAYDRLKASPFAEQIFKALEQNGTNEGKMYALKALQNLDADYFNSLAEKYQTSNEKANCQYGCIVSSVYLRHVFNS